GNGLCDFGLDRKNVLKFTIENSRPQLRSIRGVNQLRNNPYFVPLLSNGAFQKRAHTQLFADSLGFLFPVFETKGRTAADHLEVSDLPQGCDQFLRQSVRKIFVARIAAFVKQWQHRDRLPGTRRRDLVALRRSMASS